MVSETLVLAVRVPEVPVMVTGTGPAAAAVLAAVRVNTLLPVAGLVPNAAVTPVGSPEAASVTVPVNPPMSVIEMVSVVLFPGVTEADPAEGVSVKAGVPVPGTVSAIVTEWLIVPLLPVIVTLPVSPGVFGWTKKLTVTLPLALTDDGEKFA